MPVTDFRIPTLIIGVCLSAIGLFLVSFYGYARWPEKPMVTIKISRQESNYKEGLQINGVKWSKGYQAYLVGIINSSGASEISDVRLTVHLPGAILSKRIEVSDADHPKIYAFIPPVNIANNTGQIQEVQIAPTNNLTISTDKLKSQGQFFVTVVIEPKKNLTDKCFVDFTYSFIGFLEIKKVVRLIHPVVQKGEELTVDISRTLPVNFPRHFAYYGVGMEWGFDFEEKLN